MNNSHTKKPITLQPSFFHGMMHFYKQWQVLIKETQEFAHKRFNNNRFRVGDFSHLLGIPFPRGHDSKGAMNQKGSKRSSSNHYWASSMYLVIVFGGNCFLFFFLGGGGQITKKYFKSRHWYSLQSVCWSWMIHLGTWVLRARARKCGNKQWNYGLIPCPMCILYLRILYITVYSLNIVSWHHLCESYH